MQEMQNPPLAAPLKLAGRMRFLGIVCGFLVIVVLLPWLVGLLFRAFGMTSAEMAGPRIFLGMFLLPLGLIVVAVPVIKLTLQRLRDMHLSQAFVLFFPILPFYTLALGPILGALTLGIGGMPFFLNPAFWVGIVMLVALASIPGEVSGKLWSHPAFLWVQRHTQTRGTISASQFKRNLLKVIGVYLITYLCISGCIFLLSKGISLHGGSKMSGYIFFRGFVIALSIINSLVAIGALFLALVYTLRRQNDLGRSKKRMLLFPGILYVLHKSIMPLFLFVLLGKHELASLVIMRFFGWTGLLELVWLIFGVRELYVLCTKESALPSQETAAL